MKRNRGLQVVLFLGIFLFSACANSDNQEFNTANEFRRPDFGQPERKSDIRGLVKSVIGNEITILKIDRPEMSKNSENRNSKNISIGQSAGHMPGMGAGMRKNGSEEEQTQMLERMKSMATGEEKIIIPVGIQMLMANVSREKNGPIEANLADIKKDKMIQVWLDKNISDRNIANFVMIMK